MPKGGVLPDDRSKISVWIQSNCKIYAFHQLSFMWWFRKCQQKETFFGDLFYIRCQENMAWKFP